jgi:hypothetical protein
MSDTFKIKTQDKETTFLVKMPSLQNQREGQKVYNQAFSDAVKSGSIVRAKLDDLLTEQGLWDDTKQARFLTIQKELNDSEKKLAVGGISLKEAKNVAISMKKIRDELRDLISVKTNLDTHTAEGQADNARFNYLVSCCVVYNDNKKTYFSNYEDYLNRSSDPVGVLGAQKLASMLYGLDSDFEKKLPENKFLLDYKFINEDLRYVNNNGKLVDEDGRLVDENGRYINQEGKFVDREGNLVDEKGDYIVDFRPFTDDDGKPVVLEKSKNDTPATKEAIAEVVNEAKPATEPASSPSVNG